MHQSGDDRFVPMTSFSSGLWRQARTDVFYYTNQIVNVIFIGNPDHWVLVDTGMPKKGQEIQSIAEEKFGKGNKPAAIIITHGHFDHVGGLVHLVEKWNVPVYAHSLEIPFLSGKQDYPVPDVTVEGGLLAKISNYFPHEAVDVSPVLKPLPEDGSVPELPGWSWIHAPGHTPGQVLLFRESDRTLLTTDALVTVKQDEFYKVLVQEEEVCGPPVYFTLNWEEARDTCRKIYELKPQMIIPGHGNAIEGQKLLDGVKKLVDNFDELAIPKYGKFVDETYKGKMKHGL